MPTSSAARKANHASALASALQKQLNKVCTGDEVVLRTLSFEHIYRTCYKLATEFRKDRLLFRMFCVTINLAAATHRKSQGKYQLACNMICDVFGFPIHTKFGGHAPAGFDSKQLVVQTWTKVQDRFRSLRPR
jgi:hypothetical protein